MLKTFAVASIIAIAGFAGSVCADNSEGSGYFGLNIGHTVAVDLVSHAMSDSVSYVPFHIQGTYCLSNHFGISGLLLYRFERDHELLTNEVGAAVGPCLMVNGLKSFFCDVKIGVATAFGRDYEGDDYSRVDLVVQPDVGFFIPLNRTFTFCFGLGIQSLLLLNESPSRNGVWDWNSMGMFSHYYLPVLNVSIGFNSAPIKN
jgi:hypothetical protein